MHQTHIQRSAEKADTANFGQATPGLSAMDVLYRWLLPATAARVYVGAPTWPTWPGPSGAPWEGVPGGRDVKVIYKRTFHI